MRRFASWMIDRSRALGIQACPPRGTRGMPPLRGGRRPRPPGRRPCRRRRRRAAVSQTNASSLRRRTRPGSVRPATLPRVSSRHPQLGVADAAGGHPARSRSRPSTARAVHVRPVRRAEVDDPEPIAQRLDPSVAGRGDTRRRQGDDVIFGAADRERGGTELECRARAGATGSTRRRALRGHGRRTAIRLGDLGGRENEALLRGGGQVPAPRCGRPSR